MKQFFFLVSLLVAGGLGSLIHPFWGLLVYYILASLRPQNVWEWALPVQWRWSMMAALALLAGLLINANVVLNKVRINIMMVLMVIFTFLVGLSCLLAYDPVESASWASVYAKVILICLITGIVVTELWQIRALCIVIFVSLAYLSWSVNSDYLIKGNLTILHHGLGSLDNNGAALLIGLGLPFAYAFATSARQMWVRVVAAVCGLMTLHGVMLSYSRGAMVSVLAGVGWLLLHHRSMPQKLGMAAVVAIAVGVMAGPEVRERFLSTTNYQEEATAQLRFASWAAAWRIASEYPFGKGVRNSNAFSHMYGADKRGRTIHSQYLQLAADSGLPTMVFYIFMVGTSLYLFRRSRQLCLEHLDAMQAPAEDADAETHEQFRRVQRMVKQSGQLALGAQGALVIFAVDGIFLSLEVLEVPWLLMAMAGVMPAAAKRYFESHQAFWPASAPPLHDLRPPALAPRRPLALHAKPERGAA